MPAQCAQLCVGQISIGTFDIAAVPKAHELGVWIDPGCGADSGYAMPKVIDFPGKMDLVPVEPVTGYDKGAEPWRGVEPMHYLRPQHRAILIIQRDVHKFAGLVMEDFDPISARRRADSGPT